MPSLTQNTIPNTPATATTEPTAESTSSQSPSPTGMPSLTQNTIPNTPATATTEPTAESASSQAPSPTGTPAPSQKSIPNTSSTPTAAPTTRLVLSAEPTVLGYWSDGTADVEVVATLMNEGAVRSEVEQVVTVTCDASQDCRVELFLPLRDGFGPSSAEFVLRLPMGRNTVKLQVVGNELLTLHVDVQERIIGVDRNLWECYADRPEEPVEVEGEFFHSCGGWSAKNVEKWLGDVPVKVWVTGDPDYIAALDSVLMDLAPLLGLEFEWVDSEAEADFKAFVGVPSSEASAFGFDFDWTHYWGFGGSSVTKGEATSGYIVIQHLDLANFPSPADEIRSVTIHEALHALGPIGHSTRPLSIMGGSALNTWSPWDAELIELNSHPLVKPGMSMDEVRGMIILTDELLDYSQVGSEEADDDPLDLVWQVYRALEEAGSASYRLSGGWVDRACNQTFGVRRGPIEMAIGDFRQFRDDPALLYLDTHTDRFYVVYSREEDEWVHWQMSDQGTWDRVEREVIEDATLWWLWNGKLHRATRSLIMDGYSEDIVINEMADGNLQLQATLDESYVNMWDWTGEDSLDLTLTIDPKTYALTGYTWELHRNSDTYPGSCLTYREVATEGKLGVRIEVPGAVRNE